MGKSARSPQTFSKFRGYASGKDVMPKTGVWDGVDDQIVWRSVLQIHGDQSSGQESRRDIV